MRFFFFIDVMVKYCYAHMCILKQSIYQMSYVAQGPLIIMFSIHYMDKCYIHDV